MYVCKSKRHERLDSMLAVVSRSGWYVHLRMVSASICPYGTIVIMGHACMSAADRHVCRSRKDASCACPHVTCQHDVSQYSAAQGMLAASSRSFSSTTD